MYWYIAVAVIALAASYLLRPSVKTQSIKPGNIQSPTAEVGREIPVLFGTRDIESPNTLWYGDLKTITIDTNGVDVGTKYKLGMHHALCHGPVDYLRRIRVDEKVAWLGESAGGTIAIDKQHLFGGKKKEGGVKGSLDFEMGGPAQTQNAYLLAQLGDYIPAFRGITAAVLNQMYIGTTPYVRPWEYRMQRIHTIQDGDAQWYDAKAAIGLGASYGVSTGFGINTSGWEYQIGAEEASPGTTNLTPPTSGWTSGGVMPFGSGIPDAGTEWPEATVLWAKKTFTVMAGKSYTLTISFENGGIVWVNGTQVAYENTANSVFHTGAPNYTDWPISEALTATGEIEVIIKAFDEIDVVHVATWAYISMAFSGTFDEYDINPAHLIRECITNQDWGMGYAQADINDTSFMAAADTLYNEGFGMSLLRDQPEAIEDFIFDVVRTIDAALYVDIATGLWTLKLIRDDYDEGSLPELTTSNVERIEDFTRPNFGELINQVTVKYWESAQSQDQAVTVTDDALVQMQGQVIGQTNNYPGITNQAMGTTVARRDLQALSKPFASCTIYSTRAIGDLREGDPFKLIWPDYGLDAGMIMRVVEIGYGDAKDGRVRIRATEDVFSTPVYTFSVPATSDWISPVSDPAAVTDRLVQEAPYYWMLKDRGAAEADNLLAIDAGAGFIIATGDSPTGDAIDITLATDPGGGYTEYDSAAYFCPTAQLAAALIQEVGPSTVAIDTGVDIDEVEVGSLAQIDDEILRVDSISDTIAIFGRGVLDTVPAPHADNTKIYFWGIMGSDEIQRTAADSVDVKLLTVTGIGQLDQADATADTIVMDGRAIRPYPPGALTINGTEYPAEADHTITITWAGRDRIAQGTDLISNDEASIGPEAGVTYTLRGYVDAALVDEITGISAETYDFGWSGAGTGRLEVVAVRDGIEAWQPLWAEFDYVGGFPDWSVGTAYDQTLSFNRGVAPYSFAVSSGSIPGTWTLETDGQLHGPALTTEATYTFTVTVTDDNADTFDLPQSITVYQDPDWSSVKVALRFDGADASTTFTDDTGKTWTVTGNAQIDTDYSVWGGAAGLFDGSGDYIRTPDSADFAFGSGDFTIEGWIRPYDLTPSQQFIACQRTAYTSNHALSIIATSDGNIIFQSTPGGVTAFAAQGPGGLLASQWQHFSCVRNGTEIAVSINGLFGTPYTIGTTALYNSTAPFQLGASNPGGTPGEYYHGWIDDFRVTKGVARYTADFVPPQRPIPNA